MEAGRGIWWPELHFRNNSAPERAEVLDTACPIQWQANFPPITALILPFLDSKRGRAVKEDIVGFRTPVSTGCEGDTQPVLL